MRNLPASFSRRCAPAAGAASSASRFGVCVELLLVAVLLSSCGEPAIFRQERKLKLAAQLRSDLLASAFAERGAVLAVTDEKSNALALASEADAKQGDTTLAELRDLVRADGKESEKTTLEAFEADWTRLKEIDKRLLVLAVQNSNLKAAALLSREGRESTIAFSDTLEVAAKGVSDPETLRTIAKCQVSGLRSLSLLLLHVPSEDDAEMSRYEELIEQRNAEVERGLDELRTRALLPSAVLDEATRHWSSLKEVEKRALKLSRENSNVTSRQMSLDEKEKAAESTLAALDRFESAVQSSIKGSSPRR